tara:strand:+ start:1309 stop:2034 length:726 start_codon:yes stop_codon:yes gene_type:complete
MNKTWKRNNKGRLEKIETTICCIENNHEFYKYHLFNNKCSKCHLKTLSETETEKFMKNHATHHWKYERYPKKDLHWYTTDLQVSDNNGFIKLLTYMLNATDDLFHNKNHMDNILKLLYTCNYVFKGLTSKQATNIYNDWKNKHTEGLSNVTKNKLLICLQHFLGGLVIDWWNITNELGGVAYCYYANWGKAPLLFDNNHEKHPIQKPIYKYINSLNNTEEKSRFDSWIRNGTRFVHIPIIS